MLICMLVVMCRNCCQASRIFAQFGPKAAGVSETTAEFLGTSQFAVENVGDDFANVFFQWTFAATSATIVSGAAAGRMRFIAYVWMSFLQTTFVYPFVAHWVWSPDGWLHKLGVVDLAGQNAVHTLGGVMGLAATKYLGPRSGVFTSSGRYLPVRASPLNAAFGALILWYCWFEFNAGSTLGLSGERDRLAAIVAWNSGLASGAGVVSALLVSYFRSGAQYVDVFDVITGLLGALVGITGGAAVVAGWAAILIGVLTGIVGIYATELVIWFRIDDPVGAVPVHVGASIAGMVLTAFFAMDSSENRGNRHAGILYGGDGTLLGAQLAAIGATIVWGLVLGGLTVWFVDRTVGLQVTTDMQQMGMDEAEHNLVKMTLDEGSFDGDTLSDGGFSAMTNESADLGPENSFPREMPQPDAPSDTSRSMSVAEALAQLAETGDVDLESVVASPTPPAGAGRTISTSSSGKGIAEKRTGRSDSQTGMRPGGVGTLPPRPAGKEGAPGDPRAGLGSPPNQRQAPQREPPMTQAQLEKAERKRQRAQKRAIQQLLKATSAALQKRQSSGDVVFVPRDQAERVKEHYAEMAREKAAKRRKERAEARAAMRNAVSSQSLEPAAGASGESGGVVVVSVPQPLVTATSDGSLGAPIVDDTGAATAPAAAATGGDVDDSHPPPPAAGET